MESNPSQFTDCGPATLHDGGRRFTKAPRESNTSIFTFPACDIWNRIAVALRNGLGTLYARGELTTVTSFGPTGTSEVPVSHPMSTNAYCVRSVFEVRSSLMKGSIRRSGVADTS